MVQKCIYPGYTVLQCLLSQEYDLNFSLKRSLEAELKIDIFFTDTISEACNYQKVLKIIWNFSDKALNSTLFFSIFSFQDQWAAMNH